MANRVPKSQGNKICSMQNKKQNKIAEANTADMSIILYTYYIYIWL